MTLAFHLRRVFIRLDMQSHNCRHRFAGIRKKRKHVDVVANSQDDRRCHCVPTNFDVGSLREAALRKSKLRVSAGISIPIRHKSS